MLKWTNKEKDALLTITHCASAVQCWQMYIVILYPYEFSHYDMYSFLEYLNILQIDCKIYNSPYL